MVETSNAAFSVQWSAGEYLRSQAQSRKVISCTLMAAVSFESPFVLARLALPFPFGPAAVGGGATVPSAVRTPHCGALGAGRTGGACATRLARRAARSSLGADLGGSGAAGAGIGALAGGWYCGIASRFFGIAIGGTEKLCGVIGRVGGAGAAGIPGWGIPGWGIRCWGGPCWGIGCGGYAGDPGWR